MSASLVTFRQAQSTPASKPLPLPEQTPGLPPLNLVDPITSKRLRLYSPFSDQLLRLNGWQKHKLNLKESLVSLPRSIYRGLRGDPDYTFTNFLQVSKVPYYLGGAFLALSFAAGRDRVNFVRQGLGVGLYYLGVMGANTLINKMYQWRTGVDLDMRYRKSNGDIEKVFASTSFGRFDLLRDTDYEAIAGKLGIPSDIANPHLEVRQQVEQLISTSRADKLILGNGLAALGAGYLARSNAWSRLLGGGSLLRTIWKDAQGGSLLNRIANTGLALRGTVAQGVREKITGLPGESAPRLRKGVLGLAALLTGAVVLRSLYTPRTARMFESAMSENLAPSITQGLPPTQLGLANYTGEHAAFAQFREHRALAPAAGGQR